MLIGLLGGFLVWSLFFVVSVTIAHYRNQLLNNRQLDMAFMACVSAGGIVGAIVNHFF